jgi:hypothetical protein
MPSLALICGRQLPALMVGRPALRLRVPTSLEVFGGVKGSVLGFQVGKGAVVNLGPIDADQEDVPAAFDSDLAGSARRIFNASSVPAS